MNIPFGRSIILIFTLLALSSCNPSSLEKAKEFITDYGISCNGLDYNFGSEENQLEMLDKNLLIQFKKHFSENNIRCTRESIFVYGSNGKHLFEEK